MSACHILYNSVCNQYATDTNASYADAVWVDCTRASVAISLTTLESFGVASALVG